MLVCLLRMSFFSNTPSLLSAQRHKFRIRDGDAVPTTCNLSDSFAVVASLLALAVLSIIVIAADSMRKIVCLPTFLIWTGGLWLIPFRFDAVGHYWLAVLIWPHCCRYCKVHIDLECRFS